MNSSHLLSSILLLTRIVRFPNIRMTQGDARSLPRSEPPRTEHAAGTTGPPHQADGGGALRPRTHDGCARATAVPQHCPAAAPDSFEGMFMSITPIRGRRRWAAAAVALATAATGIAAALVTSAPANAVVLPNNFKSVGYMPSWAGSVNTI